MSITVKDFVQEFKDKKITNTKIAPDAVGAYIKEKLEIKTYIPFRQKREIAEMIVSQNIKEVDGIKKYDDIGSYVSLVVASIVSHTDLEFGEDVIADYDLLAESGLFGQIIAQFQGSHDEIGILLTMATTAELEDNNVNVLVGHFLNNVLQKLDGFSEVLKDKVENLDIKDVLGADFKQEDLNKLSGFLDRLN